ncbi:MAG: hypothetical protein PHF24_05080 [Syntrophomonas sp.]|nr:hypothetical protein [Syntrophomonas sp.]
MSSKDKQRINVTSHLDKDKVVQRYKELKEIIVSNSSIPFKDVINQIAGINVGTFYNYIYPGKQQGQVSLYTVENLSNYFSLPKEVFTSEVALDDDIKEKMASRIQNGFTKNSFPKNNAKSTISELNDSNVLDAIKKITISLNNESDTEVLKNGIKLLEVTLNVSKNRLENLVAIEQQFHD